ncbi:hypothetical protein G647_00993 [Cladophialophora carrionii CBS 160.54]|uniref:Uncharacterized protein n=1 Tax=Cladophialophora carrionii CBS 160.54 TaxID=1279043 RepID=V9DQF4_9EURO|nr:uncharacterized protein G647_00993 [Cladophialophora carrionii CBS 160.54]ETI28543.1 hypothetical protein G647_00993 [Cladophialophora carrionii CBS 160.54]
MELWDHLDVDLPLLDLENNSETSIGHPLLQRLRSWYQARLQHRAGTSPQATDEELIPIAEMMSTLFSEANKSVPLSKNLVFLAIPDFENSTSDTFTRSIRQLVHLAGLDRLSFQRQSQLSLLHIYNLDNCFGIWLDPVTEVPDEECEKYKGRHIQSVLSVHLDRSSLSLRSMIRDDGIFPHEPGSVKFLWADEEDAKANTTDWDGVEHALERFLHDHDIMFDLLLLSGAHVKASDFQRIIRDRFKDNEKIVAQDYLRGSKDHLFAAARGAAQLARVRLCVGDDACMPNSWCPISEHCKKWAWYIDSDDHAVRKTEL